MIKEQPQSAPPSSDIVCFANDWAADPLSKKQVMTRLARRHRVLWINSINNRRPQLAGKDFRRILQKLGDFGKGLERVDENVWLLAPIFVPFHGMAWTRSLNRRLLAWQIRWAMRRLQFTNPITWTFVPTSADVVGSLGERLVVYHCVDEYGAFSDAAPEVRLREQELLAKSGLVIVCSQALLEAKKKSNPNTHLVTHGVDYEHFRRAANPQTPIAPELARLPRPILGFHGLIADWVDLPLLADLARLRPTWTIVLVGRPDTNVSSIAGIPNIHLLGHRPYEKLPNYLRGFDVALLPFVQNELTISANPLKLREYLAAGLPVVATPIPEVERLAPPVRLASTAEGYAREIENLLTQDQAGAALQRSDQWAEESWDHKVAELERLLHSVNSNAAAALAPHRMPELCDLNLKFVRSWRGRHSEITEYAPMNGERRGPVVIKRLTRWKDSADAERLLQREGDVLQRLSALGPPLRGSVPALIRTLPQLKMLVVSKVAGVPFSQVLRQRANRITGAFGEGCVLEIGQRAGEWLRNFHNATRQDDGMFDASVFLAAFDQRITRCSQAGADPGFLQRLSRPAALAAETLDRTTVRMAARHGDFLPQNLLVHAGEIAVVDFENYDENDSVFEDLATFVAYAALLRTSPIYSKTTLTRMADRFIRGYGQPGHQKILDLYVLKAELVILSEYLRGRSARSAASKRIVQMQAEIDSAAQALAMQETRNPPR